MKIFLCRLALWAFLLVCPAAFGQGATPNLAKAVSRPDSWVLQAQGGAQAKLSVDHDSLKVTVSAVDSTSWHVQLWQRLPPLESGKTYAIAFEVRAAGPRSMGLAAAIADGDYHDIGLPREKVQFGSGWQWFRRTFVASNTAPSVNRIPYFIVGERVGTIWIRHVVLREVPAEVPAGGAVAPPVSPPEAAALAVPLVPPGRARLPDGSFDYRFDGHIVRGVLENYLARAITETDLLRGNGSAEDDDNVRMLLNIGTKFVGRSIMLWGSEAALPSRLASARRIAQRLHAADPDVILEAGEFEIVTPQVEQLPVPDWVFREFNLPVEGRHFRYAEMLYSDGHGKNQWGPEWKNPGSVPDMSRLETRLWFFYLAASYIDVGCEAIHFGQVGIMDQKDPGHAFWFDELAHVQRYAAAHARRHLVLCNAHEADGGVVEGGRLLFDFHEFPLRIKEVAGRPQEGVLEVGFSNSFYGRSRGGVTPSGWGCAHLPYLVEFDNFGTTGHEGEDWHGDGNPCWVWGCDEIGWLAHQNLDYRNWWLGYAWGWVRAHDPNGYVEMPGRRTLAWPVGGSVRSYRANTPGPAVPTGFGQEETIKALWARDRPSTSPK